MGNQFEQICLFVILDFCSMYTCIISVQCIHVFFSLQINLELKAHVAHTFPRLQYSVLLRPQIYILRAPNIEAKAKCTHKASRKNMVNNNIKLILRASRQNLSLYLSSTIEPSNFAGSRFRNTYSKTLMMN